MSCSQAGERGFPCVFSHVGFRSILEPLVERRISAASRTEELSAKDDGENRINKLKRKERSISRSQVIVEKEPEAELTSKTVINELWQWNSLWEHPSSFLLVVACFLVKILGRTQIPAVLVTAHESTVP